MYPLPDVCMAVLNWNGRRHLESLIPSLIKAKDQYPSKCRVLVLNNPSSADDLSWVRENFPTVDTVEAPQNDYLYSYNWLIPQLEEPVVILLNNDLKVDPGFLEPLVRPFQDPSIFAVGATSLEWDGSAVTSAAYRLGMHHGWGYFDGFESKEAVYTLFAVGGFMAIDRRKFLELGGFDRLYYPAYGEDADLCLRAWTMGWSSVYQPLSIVWHREGASWDGEQALKREYLMTRSQYLFNCRHISALSERLKRSLYLLVSSLRSKKDGKRIWLKAVNDARTHWGKLGAASKTSITHGALESALGKVGKPWIVSGT